MVFECARKNWFCLVCGHYVFNRNKRNLTDDFQEAYSLYFGTDIDTLKNKPWIPDKVCAQCHHLLVGWFNNTTTLTIKYSQPVIWDVQEEHNEQNCYFCANKTFGFNIKNLKHIQYNNVPSITPAQLRQPDEEIPPAPQTYSPPSDVLGVQFPSTSSGSEYVPSERFVETPILMSQKYFNDLVKDLELTKAKAEVLGSRLKNLRMLERDVRITQQRIRSREVQEYFETSDNLVYCKDIEGVMLYLNIPLDFEQWRLFIDSSKYSLKAVLLHNGNIHRAFPVAYTNQKEESYENIANLLEKINYNRYKWKLCGDLKVVAIVSGLQQGYTKHMCFLCDWNTRSTNLHYSKKNWNLRTYHEIGALNVIKEPLVFRENILLPPLHIKLGLIKNFVKSLDRSSEAFQYLVRKFPSISIAKIKEGVFVGPDIRKIMTSEEFYGKLNDLQKLAFDFMNLVIDGFLGNKRYKEYKENIDNMLIAFENIGVNMSLKIHFLHSHLDFFAENLGAVSDEHGERFHQEIKVLEERFKGKSRISMLSEYVWSLFREIDDEEHSRRAKYPRKN